MTTRRAQTIEMPAVVCEAGPIAKADYTYCCEIEIPTGDDRSAERWARDVFEGAPRPVRSFLVFGWLVGLRLRLGSRRSPEHVLGWRLVTSSSKLAVLGVESFLLETWLVISLDEGKARHATLLRYRRWAGRPLWAPVAPLHELIIRYLMTTAARRTSPSA